MKYTKLWLEAVNNFNGNAFHAEDVLDALAEVGALKIPPKPREWWVCEGCGQVAKTNVTHCSTNPGRVSHGMIHVREVMEDE